MCSIALFEGHDTDPLIEPLFSFSAQELLKHMRWMKSRQKHQSRSVNEGTASAIAEDIRLISGRIGSGPSKYQTASSYFRMPLVYRA